MKSNPWVSTCDSAWLDQWDILWHEGKLLEDSKVVSSEPCLENALLALAGEEGGDVGDELTNSPLDLMPPA